MTTDQAQLFQNYDVNYMIKLEAVDTAFQDASMTPNQHAPPQTMEYQDHAFFFAQTSNCPAPHAANVMPCTPAASGNAPPPTMTMYQSTNMMPTTPTTPNTTTSFSSATHAAAGGYNSTVSPCSSSSADTMAPSPVTLPFSPMPTFDSPPRPIMTTSASAPTTMMSMTPVSSSANMSPSHQHLANDMDRSIGHYANPAVNSELKRQIHIQSEQKRRAQIKDGFEDLRNELPSCLNKKMSKVALLHRTVQHIQHLKSTQATILSELERLMVENEHLRKFQQSVLQKQNGPTGAQYQVNSTL
ncbi:hypothetical protein BC940DRAFT_302866 [Gongronella butleri]|nr:hypothetical protein BC940DRAFT_302866 [Gongronella butleri]